MAKYYTYNITPFVTLIEFSHISDVGTFLHSRQRDPENITRVLEYVLSSTRILSKKTQSDMYSLLLEMSKRTKSVKILEDTELVFHDSDSEVDNIPYPEDILGEEVPSSKRLVLTFSSEIEFDDQDSDNDLVYPYTYYLPILFTTDKSGKERMWKIWVIDDTVHRLQGLLSGKKIPYKRVYKGKNVGKANKTTAEEQAKRAAE